MRRPLLIAALPVLVTGCAGDDSVRPLSSLSMLERPGSYGVVIDAKSGRAVAAFRVNRPIRAAAADGEGGWYVGGSFIRVNGKLRKRLAHVDADGKLDPSWRPEANGNGVSVDGLALAGSRLYVTGDFERLNREPRIHLGVVGARTGRLGAWNEANEVGGFGVLDLYAGRAIVGTPRAQLAAISVHGGRRWSMPIGVGLEGGGVRDFAAVGRRLYIQGMFESVAGEPRRGLAALHVSNGALDRRWRPQSFAPRAWGCLGCSGAETIAASSRRVYVSVLRTRAVGPTLSPVPFSRVVAVDARSGVPASGWHRADTDTAAPGPNEVEALALAEGRVYAGGSFHRIHGRRQHGLAALDASTGRPLSAWSPRANTTSVSVLIPSRSRLLVGVTLSNEVGFAVDRFPFGRRIKAGTRAAGATVSLSGPGAVTLELGRIARGHSCTTDARCPGPTLRTRSLSFPHEDIKRIAVPLAGLRAGRYFLRFTVRGRGGPEQRPLAYPFRLVP